MDSLPINPGAVGNKISEFVGYRYLERVGNAPNLNYLIVPGSNRNIPWRIMPGRDSIIKNGILKGRIRGADDITPDLCPQVESGSCIPVEIRRSVKR